MYMCVRLVLLSYDGVTVAINYDDGDDDDDGHSDD